MAIMAYYLKLHAPGAKTFLQIIRVFLFNYYFCYYCFSYFILIIILINNSKSRLGLVGEPI